jgi:outer membrane protein assembly factor BamB
MARRQRGGSAVLVTLALVLVAGCTAPDDDGHGGCGPQVLTGEVLRHSATNGSVVWRRASAPFRPGAFAVRRTGVVIAGGQLGDERIVRVLDPGTGAELWSEPTGAEDTLVAATDDVVYLGSGDRRSLEARRLIDGKPLWKRTDVPDLTRDTGTHFAAMVAYGDGVLVTAYDSGSPLFALARDTGDTVLETDLVAVVTRLMDTSNAHAVDRTDSVAWRVLSGARSDAWLDTTQGGAGVATDGTVVAGALRRSGGTVQVATVRGSVTSAWRRDLRFPEGRVLLSMPAPGVLLVHGGNRLRRLSLETGRDMWVYDLPQANAFANPPLAPTALPIEGALLVVSSAPDPRGVLHSSVDLIDATTGVRRARARSVGLVSPAADTGVVLVQDDNRTGQPSTPPRLLRPSVVGRTFNVATARHPVGPPLVLGDAVYVLASAQPVFCA